MKFVNAYKVTREFGGHEEGGWWYDHYQCIETFPVRGQEQAEDTKQWLEEEHKGIVYGNISSVLGGAELDVMIEDEPAQSQTREKPIYE